MSAVRTPTNHCSSEPIINQTSDPKPNNFVAKLFDILNENDPEELRPIQWTSDGTAALIYPTQLDTYLKTSASLGITNVKSLIRQLTVLGFENVTSQEKFRDTPSTRNDYLIYSHPEFRRGCTDRIANITRSGATQQQTAKHFYCPTEKNYLRYQRRHDPCYRLVGRLTQYRRAWMNINTVMEKEKLKRIVRGKLMARGGGDLSSNQFNEVMKEFLVPSETNIQIQMGAIAGYYGESVEENDLIGFYGKYLPTYKPISEVVDSITPSVSSKIQASNFILEGTADGQSQSRARSSAAIASGSSSSSSSNNTGNTLAPAHKLLTSPDKQLFVDTHSDITFEYVSFKNKTDTAVAAAVDRGGDQVLNLVVDQPEYLGFGPMARGANKVMDGTENEAYEEEEGRTSLDGNSVYTSAAGPEVAMPQFSHQLLDANYYDGQDDVIYSELKNAIDLIMN